MRMSKSNLDEYIKRGEAIEALGDDYKLCFATDPTIDTPYYKMKRAAVCVITGVHAASVAPIVKSTWGSALSFSGGNEDIECNNCGEWFNSIELCGRMGEANFCPNCGAAMTEKALQILAKRNEEKKDE